MEGIVLITVYTSIYLDASRDDASEAPTMSIYRRVITIYININSMTEKSAENKV
jgi:hypothetical protein